VFPLNLTLQSFTNKTKATVCIYIYQHVGRP
jgi:hypothetical protein